MFNIEIQGLDIKVSKNNINIKDSYKINNRLVMRMILDVLKNEVKEEHLESPFDKRNIGGMVREWVAHNNLYKLGYKKDRMCNVDLNYPQKWYVPIVYWILSLIEL